MMEYKLPPLPPYFYGKEAGDNEKCLSIDEVERYVKKVVSPLLSEIERLENLLFEANQYDEGGDYVPE